MEELRSLRSLASVCMGVHVDVTHKVPLSIDVIIYMYTVNWYKRVKDDAAQFNLPDCC